MSSDGEELSNSDKDAGRSRPQTKDDLEYHLNNPTILTHGRADEYQEGTRKSPKNLVPPLFLNKTNREMAGVGNAQQRGPLQTDPSPRGVSQSSGSNSNHAMRKRIRYSDYHSVTSSTSPWMRHNYTATYSSPMVEDEDLVQLKL